MTDVWTSVGVLAGVGLVALTGWERLDSIVAFIVAANIIWSGVRIVRKSALGLMDTALPIKEQTKVKDILEKYTQNGVEYHALRPANPVAAVCVISCISSEMDFSAVIACESIKQTSAMRCKCYRVHAFRVTNDPAS
jgi:divalent metal cation (Fe/Co/Zn/Cd) transporter